MGKTLYKKIKEMLDEIKKEKEIVSKDEIRSQIIIKIGSDERTFKRVTGTINQLKMLEDLPDGRFKII